MHNRAAPSGVWVCVLQDTSTGQIIAQHRTKMGPCDVLRHNPYNAVSLLGHAQGVVTMWTPNMTSPVVKMLAHRVSCLTYNHAPVQSVCAVPAYYVNSCTSHLNFTQYCLFLFTWASHFVTVHVVSMLLGWSHTELSSQLAFCTATRSWQIPTSCMSTVKPLHSSRKTPLCCVLRFQSHAVFHDTSHTLLHINPKAKMAVMNLSDLLASTSAEHWPSPC